MDVTVAVLTFRRNEQLSALLPLLMEEIAILRDRAGLRGEVVVVDNDPNGGAGRVVRPAAGVRYVHEVTPGIAAARNRALSESGDSTFLAFIDDDERPGPGWLNHLVQAQAHYGADGVSGPVVSQFDGALDPWLKAGGFFQRSHNLSRTTGDRVPAAATNNLLLNLEVVRRLGLDFDTSLGMGGGEDTLFTRRLVAGGGAIVWCSEARVFDLVPTARMTRRFALTRVFAQSNASAVVTMRALPRGLARVRSRVRFAGVGLARLLAGSSTLLAGCVTRSPRSQARGSAMAVRGLGALCAALGIRYAEYQRSGSSCLAA